MKDRLFIGIYPGGIVYADQKRERHGDYARLAFLAYDTLELSVEKDCPANLRSEIERNAAAIQARKGEPFSLDACGHTVTLGSKLIEQEEERQRKEECEQHLLATMGEFIDMADGWSNTGKWSLWLFFRTEQKLREVAAKLKAAGHRRLEAFPSPPHAEGRQLSFTMTVELRNVLETENSQRLGGLMREIGIDAASVKDMHDGTLLVTVDSDADEKLLLSVFQKFWTKAGGGRIVPHVGWCKDSLGLVTEYRVPSVKEETASV